MREIHPRVITPGPLRLHHDLTATKRLATANTRHLVYGACSMFARTQ